MHSPASREPFFYFPTETCLLHHSIEASLNQFCMTPFLTVAKIADAIIVPALILIVLTITSRLFIVPNIKIYDVCICLFACLLIFAFY